MNSLRYASVVVLVSMLLMAAALSVAAGSLADAPRGFTPTDTPTTTSTPTPVVPAASTPTPAATPVPLLPETGDVQGVDSSLLLALGVMLALALPLVILARSTREGRRQKPSRPGGD